MHRQLKLFLELLKIDKPDLLALDQELQSLWNACKEEIDERQIPTTFNISQTHKYIMTAFIDLGYDVQMEKKLSGLQCDLYIPKLDLLINVDGPTHHKNRSNVPMDSSIYSHRILGHYHKNYINIRSAVIFKEIKNDNFDNLEPAKQIIREALKPHGIIV